MRKGWFQIEGVQDGDRTLEQQLTGLESALAETSGKRVLDLGCAEGLIARAFARAGATDVLGVECNPDSVNVARAQCPPPVRTELANLNDYVVPQGPWDIVLALAILHKLKEPAGLVEQIAGVRPDLVVVRLPGGSTGRFTTKHHGTEVDLNAVFQAHEFRLDRTLPGPYGELVQYWR